MRTFAVALVVLGIAALVFGGFGYDRSTTIMDLGGVKATTTEHKTIPVAPIVGGIALLSGVALLVIRRPRAA